MDYRERWELKDYLVGKVLERRIVLFQVALVLLFFAFLLNFWYLQGVRGAEYADLAEHNRLRRIPTLPIRGAVVDRRGVVLASTRPSLDLVLLREGAGDVEPQLRRLVPILGLSYEDLVARVERGKNRPAFEPLVLKEDVGLEELAQIEGRREIFPSLEVRQTARRSYPQGELCAHVLGYVGQVDEGQLARESHLQLGDIVGKTGLEYGYDDRLRGQRGWDLVSVNNVGRRVGRSSVDRQPQHGESVELTIDLRLQAALRAALGPEVGAGVFLDPWTGEILALVSTPSFDPNLFADGISGEAWKAIAGDPQKPLTDRAIASFYAPGSGFKVLMALVGLETGAITPDQTVYCNGATSVYGRKRLCWKRGGHGTVDLRRALAHSCNVYFYLLGQKVGIEPIHDLGHKLGLGRPTGIDLPREAGGTLPSDAWKLEHMDEPWYPGDTISVAIGQGLLAVTPIQMATMMSVVATSGSLPRPHLVKGRGRPPVTLGLRAESFRIVREALRDAVAVGTGRSADLPTVEVAGKTGTAQVFKHSAGIDADRLPKDERDHAWFVGYAPADHPRIAFGIVVEHGGHGGTLAAPIARKVLEVFFTEPEPAVPAGDAVRAAASPPAGQSHDPTAATR